jgi:hypothetical protein
MSRLAWNGPRRLSGVRRTILNGFTIQRSATPPGGGLRRAEFQPEKIAQRYDWLYEYNALTVPI